MAVTFNTLLIIQIRCVETEIRRLGLHLDISRQKIIITLTFRKCAKDLFMGGKNVIVSYRHSFSKDCGLNKSDPRIMFEPGDQGSLKGHTYEMCVGKQICVH